MARGAARHLANLGMVSIEGFVPARGLRVDGVALGPKAETGWWSASHARRTIKQFPNGRVT